MQPIDARVKSQLRMLTTTATILLLSACGGTGNLSPTPDTEQASGTDSGNETVPLPKDITGPLACNSEASQMQARTLRLINQARSKGRMCGNKYLPAALELSWNSKLETTAASHSADMAANNFFSHTGSDGSSVGARADITNYNWRAIGENIAAGQDNIADAVDGWLASSGHCTNIMSQDFTQTALACVADSRSDYGSYWTNVLGAQAQ